MVYHELFSSWEDVQRQFGMNDPEPDKVLYAYYDHEDYGCDGRADVFYRDKGKFYYNSGGHCSCHGLEDQWGPEEYSVEALVGQVERATYGFFKDQKELIMAAVEDYKSPIADLAAEYGQVQLQLQVAREDLTEAEQRVDYLDKRETELREQLKGMLN